MPTVIIIVRPDDLQALTRPALDLTTGQLIDLAEAESPQLELPLEPQPPNPDRSPATWRLQHSPCDDGVAA